MESEVRKKLELADSLGVGMDEEILACCMNILEMGCCPEKLAAIYMEMEKELCGEEHRELLP